MEGIKHFSHEHPLSFFQDDDYEDPKPYICSICGLPILSSPSYACSTDGCKFFLHKPCAELPITLKEARHHPVEPRILHSLSLKPNSNGQKNFSYKCHDCKFDIHPLVAVPVEIKTRHKSHPSHPLVASCRETSCQCDVRGEKHNGFFFFCQECHFWIHQNCTLLQSFVNLPSLSYTFFLKYSLSDAYRPIIPTCKICNRFMLRKIGLYYCASEGEIYAHVRCAMPDTENLEIETTSIPQVIQLPDDGDTFPSLGIRQRLSIPYHDNKLTIEKYHSHHNLILHDDGTNRSSSSREAYNLVCDVCIQPINISSPFYTCLDCHFLAHSVCANPKSSWEIAFPEKFIELSLCPDQSEWFFNSVFPCVGCLRPCNGFCYRTVDNNYSYVYDLECITAPSTIKHASHGQHVLFRADDTNPLFSCCSVKSPLTPFYGCIICDFCIHVRCSLLPKRTHHKFDDHPLYLITTTLTHDDQSKEYCGCFCEVCEKKVNQQYWYYGCTECGHYFHINCIPSVGYLSRVKFGRTLNIPCHIHAVALARMLTVVSQRCGYCHQIIKGYVDDMAFHCSECDFWIHFSCARDSASSSRTTDDLYWEVDDDVKLLREMIVNTD